MAETGSGGSGFSGRPSRGSGSFTVHLADELEVYFNEVAHGRPVGFVASSKWKPPTDIYEIEDALVVYMDIAGMRAEDFTVEFADGILTIGGERKPRREGKPHYHAMEVQVGPFERRFRLPVPVDPDSIRASYEHGFLEVRLAKIQARPDELYEVGTLGSVVRMLKLGDGSVRVMVQGLERARLVDVGPAEHWLVAGYETLASGAPEDARTEALKRTVQAQFSRVIDIAPYLGEELHEVLAGITDGSKLADFAAANLDLALPAKAELLSIDDVNRRLERHAPVEPHLRGPARPEGRPRDPRSRPLRPEGGEGAYPRVSRGAHPQPAGARQHPLFRGAARRRQDVAGPEHRRGAGAALHARVARWRARRSGGPRPSPHLRRCPPGSHHPCAAALRDAQPPAHARRGGQDGCRRPGRPDGRAARGARSRAERLVRRPLPRGPVRSLGRHVHRHRE